MKRTVPTIQLLLLAALLFAALPCRADNSTKAAAQEENRFLFVIDTSSSMSSCSNAVVQDVVELLESDLKGEFRRGDTIGLWTYNDRLHPEFPMEVWSRTDKDVIVADIAAFLEERRFGRRAHFDRIMPELNHVIKNSRRVTIVLFSGGAGLIQGTPFDKEIDALQKEYGKEFRATHEPFVTVLAARNGAVFDYTVNYPGLVAIPHTANPEPPAPTNPPVVVETPPAPAPPPPLRSFIMVATPKVVQPVAPPPVVVTPPVAPTPEPQPVPVNVVPVTAPSVAVVAPAPESQPLPVTAPPAPSQTAPPQAQPTAAPIVARQNSEPVIPTPAPQAPPVAATANDQTPPPTAPVVPNPPVASVSPPGNSELPLFVIAFSLLAIAIALVIFLIRRSRGAPHSSLITQSIDRPR
jgi:hypothetical protein